MQNSEGAEMLGAHAFSWLSLAVWIYGWDCCVERVNEQSIGKDGGLPGMKPGKTRARDGEQYKMESQSEPEA